MHGGLAPAGLLLLPHALRRPSLVGAGQQQDAACHMPAGGPCWHRQDGNGGNCGHRERFPLCQGGATGGRTCARDAYNPLPTTAAHRSSHGSVAAPAAEMNNEK